MHRIKNTKIKKAKYSPPQVLQLEDLKNGQGECTNGSGDADTCDVGNQAQGGCFLGNDPAI